MKRFIMFIAKTNRSPRERPFSQLNIKRKEKENKLGKHKRATSAFPSMPILQFSQNSLRVTRCGVKTKPP